MGAAPLELEARLQREYRQSLQAAFAESGYPGEVSWPDPMADMGGDQEAAAAFIVAELSAALRNAVMRSRRAGVATVAQWRFVVPWRRVRRRRLLRSEEHTSELHSLMRIPSAVFFMQKKTTQKH